MSFSKNEDSSSILEISAKICAKCTILKPRTEFSSKVGGYCRSCQSDYMKAWYAKNKIKDRLRKTYEKSRRRAKLRDYLSKIKSETPCADCGKTYPSYVMDFDHLKDKKYVISTMPMSHTLNQIIEEISKCQIVCSNCHRERTHNRLTEVNY